MTDRLRRKMLAGLAAMLLFAPATRAQDAAAGAIRDVIAGQLQAFLADDAERAWSYASPGIQRMFGTTDTFMSMVRQGYPPVYRPKSYVFGEQRPSPAGPEQEVHIVDAANESWVAVYTMEQQSDGAWRIAGCRLVKAVPNSA